MHDNATKFVKLAYKINEGRDTKVGLIILNVLNMAFVCPIKNIPIYGLG